MAVIVPDEVNVRYDVIEGGTVIAFVELLFAFPVVLTGLPAALLSDGLGNTHRCTSAAPHVTAPGAYPAWVHLRFREVPAFDDLEILEVGDDFAITNVGGDPLAAGSYPVMRR